MKESCLQIFVTGVTGQVGWELNRSLLPLGLVVPLSRADADLSRPENLAQLIRQRRPRVVVNPAAYTAVDRAESEEALAAQVNGVALGIIAEACKEVDALLVHYSTDYVFDGEKQGAYVETDTTAPKSAYGRSKLAGEKALQSAQADYLLLRTSWVYGRRGNNFLKTMLRLANERDEIRVVADQHGVPSWSRLIADTTAQLVALRLRDRIAPRQTLHLSARGPTTWHGFASEIIQRGAKLGLCKAIKVHPIATSEYPTPAKRPLNSVLAVDLLEQQSQLQMPDWKACVQACLAEL